MIREQARETLNGMSLEDCIKMWNDSAKAEEELLGFADLDDEFEIDIRADKVDMLKREVDEYLKKMESIDKRKALEAENTEFDYGHNVKHYRED